MTLLEFRKLRRGDKVVEWRGKIYEFRGYASNPGLPINYHRTQVICNITIYGDEGVRNWYGQDFMKVFELYKPKEQ